MVRVTAHKGFNQSVLTDPALFDLSDTYLVSGGVSFGSVTVDDALIRLADGTRSRPMTVLGGSGIAIGDVGIATGGTLTNLLSGAGIGTRFTHVDWSVSGASLDLVALQAAANVNKLGPLVTQMFSGNDIFDLSNEADVVQAGAGDDVLRGKGGDDLLYGGAGHDVFYGGTGRDYMSGGAGDDWYFVDRMDDGVNEIDPNSDRIYIDMGGYDRVYSTSSFSLSYGSSGMFVEYLKLLGTANIDGTGNNKANLIIGNSGNNVLLGQSGDDVIKGMAGDDRLGGGFDKDRLSGGAGADTFVFFDYDRQYGGMDTILDFSRAEGDKIDVSAIDADRSNSTGLDKYIFIGTESFHHVAAELRVDHNSRGTYVQGDSDGDGVTDFSIRLIGNIALEASDFVF